MKKTIGIVGGMGPLATCDLFKKIIELTDASCDQEHVLSLIHILIIDRKAINSPVAEKKNLLVAMFQTAYEKYIPTLEEDGVLVIDPGLVTNQTRPIANTFEVPATQIAVDLGNRMAANMVMLGFLSEALGIIKHQDLLDVVKDTVNPRFVELNFKAVEAGAAYAKEHNLYYK